MRKTFKDNGGYFKWLNKNLGKINIFKLIATRNEIIVYYEKEEKI